MILGIEIELRRCDSCECVLSVSAWVCVWVVFFEWVILHLRNLKRPDCFFFLQIFFSPKNLSFCRPPSISTWRTCHTVKRELTVPHLFATKILCERARARTFLLQKRNHNVRDTLINQPVQLDDDDDDEFVDAQATKAISSTQPNHARVFCQRWKGKRVSTTNFFGIRTDGPTEPTEKRRSQNCQWSRRSVFRGYFHRALPNQFRYVSSLFLVVLFRLDFWIFNSWRKREMDATNLSFLFAFVFVFGCLHPGKKSTSVLFLCLPFSKSLSKI